MCKGDLLRIIAADSSSAVLDSKFEPEFIVATASVMVKPPYREPTNWLAEPVFIDATKGHEVVVHEAELCRDLLGKVKADSVHLDMSLGGIPLEQFSPIQLTNLHVSARAKRHLLRILPRIRKIAGEISQKYGVEVLAIGKESVPVRIAELTSAAHAILYVAEKVGKERKTVLLGLPSRCQPRLISGYVYVHSLMSAEHDIRGFAPDPDRILKKINIVEMCNPVARGFRTLKVTPRRQ
jgi:hypothetical protein